MSDYDPNDAKHEVAMAFLYEDARMIARRDSLHESCPDQFLLTIEGQRGYSVHETARRAHKEGLRATAKTRNLYHILELGLSPSMIPTALALDSR